MSNSDPEEIVRLYDVELLSIREIAKRLRMSYGAVQRIVSGNTTPRSNGARAPGGAEPLPCGSRKAYQRHISRGEEPDELCRQANRDYTRAFNRRTGASRARNRAYRRLAMNFSDVFDALFIEEKLRAETEDQNLDADIRRTRARERAHRRLARLYPGAFRLIFEAEKTAAEKEVGQANDARPTPGRQSEPSGGIGVRNHPP
ncbi:MAG TPA: hypothetical protein VF069_24450 [Streptosporangiaceae bacterium]